MGMARPGGVASSLPQQIEEDPETLIKEELDEDFEEIEEYSGDGEIDPGEAATAEVAAIEAEARRQGWRPLAEYRGKAGGWVDAKTFLERGENFLPFVQKERNDLRREREAMKGEIDGLRSELAQTRGEMQKYVKFARDADQRGYDRAIRELKAKQRAAVEAGDTATFDQVEEQIEQMETARNEVAAEPAPSPTAAPRPQPAANQPPEIAQWMADNEGWFMNDRVLNSAMIAEHNAVLEESPGMDKLEQLELAKERVMKRFPKKFGLPDQQESAPQQPQRPRRPAAPMAPSGSARPQNRQVTGIDAIQDLRERQAVRDGFKRARRNVPDLTEEEYLAVYENPHEDVLEVRQQAKRRRAGGK